MTGRQALGSPWVDATEAAPCAACGKRRGHACDATEWDWFRVRGLSSWDNADRDAFTPAQVIGGR